MKEITLDDLRQMEDQEGLILQGCGGDLQEWLDGINEDLTEAGILLNGSKFEGIQRFEYNGATCLLFPFEGVELSMARLATWKVRRYPNFGCTWLSDFVPSKLGGFLSPQQEVEKPDCPLIGEDGNIFNLMGIAARTLRQAGQQEHAKEMQERIMHGDCHSYDAALGIIGEYVNITSRDEMQGMGGMQFG